MIGSSLAYTPPVLKGLIIDPKEPFKFDFILNRGDDTASEHSLKYESEKLIRYFLASLTIPEDDIWVNLSPYEKNKIIPHEFGKTEMGRNLLMQNYLLKQVTSSLIYPEDNLGKKFWKRIYTKTKELYGVIDIPINTFNKVWIIPKKAVVYENGNKVFIVESKLKIMLEEDYLALEHNSHAIKEKNPSSDGKPLKPTSNLASKIIREVILPEIEKEINSGENFAKLRQIFHSLILSAWFKQNLKKSILGRAYVDKNKILGVDVKDKDIKHKIYNQYLKAFKSGVYDYIHEEYDSQTMTIIPKRYFAGGLTLKVILDKVKALPQHLGGVDINEKLILIEGIYHRPRAAPQSVNDFIKKQFQKGNVHVGKPLHLKKGQYRKVYYVTDLLKERGQLGHIGFVEKDATGKKVTGGLEVIFLDAKYGTQEIVRNHEILKVSRWVEKGKSLKLQPEQMRKWLQNNFQEAVAFLQKVDQEAEEKYPIEFIYKQAEKIGDLPSNQKIAATYSEKNDLLDLNLAAARTADPPKKTTYTPDIVPEMLDVVNFFKEKVLTPEWQQYLLGIHAMANPGNNLKQGLYMGSGSDASSYLLSTNAENSYFFDNNRVEKHSLQILEEDDESDNPIIRPITMAYSLTHYAHEKSKRGGSSQTKMLNAESSKLTMGQILDGQSVPLSIFIRTHLSSISRNKPVSRWQFKRRIRRNAYFA